MHRLNQSWSGEEKKCSQCSGRAREFFVYFSSSFLFFVCPIVSFHFFFSFFGNDKKKLLIKKICLQSDGLLVVSFIFGVYACCVCVSFWCVLLFNVIVESLFIVRQFPAHVLSVRVRPLCAYTLSFALTLDHCAKASCEGYGRLSNANNACCDSVVRVFFSLLC